MLLQLKLTSFWKFYLLETKNFEIIEMFILRTFLPSRVTENSQSFVQMFRYTMIINFFLECCTSTFLFFFFKFSTLLTLLFIRQMRRMVILVKSFSKCSLLRAKTNFLKIVYTTPELLATLLNSISSKLNFIFHIIYCNVLNNFYL